MLITIYKNLHENTIKSNDEYGKSWYMSSVQNLKNRSVHKKWLKIDENLFKKLVTVTTVRQKWKKKSAHCQEPA